MSKLRNAIAEGESKRAKEQQEQYLLGAKLAAEQRDQEARNQQIKETKTRYSWGYFQNEIMPHVREIASIKNIPLRTFKSGIVGEIFGTGHGELPSRSGFESGIYYDNDKQVAFSWCLLVWDVRWNGEEGTWQKLEVKVDDSGTVFGIGKGNISLTAPDGRANLLNSLAEVMRDNGYYDSWHPAERSGEGY